MLALDLPGFTILETSHLGNTVFITISPTRSEACCPGCSTPSRQVHSHYTRQLRDLPLQGCPVELRVRVRRFRCTLSSSPRKTFVEPLDGLAERYAQRTSRLTDVLRALILRVSSHVGAYLAERLAIPVSPRTLLRLVDRSQPTPGKLRVVGIDDFALRRGRTYATLICDLETGEPVDIVWSRNAEPVRQWLEEHPEIEIVARDRATSYADAVNTALPHAIQVADRFHLVRNVMDALKEVVDSRRWTLPQPAAMAEHHPSSDPQASKRAPVSRQQARKEAVAQRQRERYEEIHRRYRQGESLRSIARTMGLDRRTVRKYLRAREVPAYAPRAPRQRKIDPFLSYLRQRWEAGCHNARRLYEELVTLGYDGALSTLRQVISSWRAGSGQPSDPVPPAPLQWRDVRRLVLSMPERLCAKQKEHLALLLDLNPPLKLAHTLAQWFRHLLRERRGDELARWLEAAASSNLPAFRRLAKTMSEDVAAIRAGIELPWSTGPVEGHIHRVKLLKRLGYGRASLGLLRARVIGQ